MAKVLESIEYRGWKNSYRLSNGTLELIVLADIGPRVIFFGFCGGENVLHEVEQDAGQCGGSEFRLYGGHRLWVSPEVKRTYFPDNAPVGVSERGNGGCFTAPIESAHPGTNLQKELEIVLAPRGSQVTLTHRITNHDTRSTQLAPWAPTLMRAGGRAILPLPSRAAMDKDHYLPTGLFALWPYTDLSDSRWVFGTEYIQLKQLTTPNGRFREQMGGIYNPAGWGAYYRDGNLFVKRAPVIAGAEYPDFGCNSEVFTNPDFLELETLGPLVELAPRQSTTHTEVWSLFRGVPAGEDEEWIRSAIVPLVASAGSGH